MAEIVDASAVLPKCLFIRNYSSMPGASSSVKDSTELISSEELSSVAASAASLVAYLVTYS